MRDIDDEKEKVLDYYGKMVCFTTTIKGTVRAFVPARNLLTSNIKTTFDSLSIWGASDCIDEATNQISWEFSEEKAQEAMNFCDNNSIPAFRTP